MNVLVNVHERGKTIFRKRYMIRNVKSAIVFNVIIDCHCHAGKGDGLTHPRNTSATLKDYLLRATQSGINQTVLFSALHSNYAAANREVARIVLNSPNRFYGFAFVNSIRDRGRIEVVVRESVLRYGFVGIKVHRRNARISREICEVARKYRLPVLYDIMGEVSMVELIATEYPDVNFIIPHLSSFDDNWHAQLAFIDQLVRHPNVYTDTAGVRRFDLLVEATRRAGAHKILFGSDGPWLHPGVELAKIKALGLSRMDEAKILGGNFLGLIRHLRNSLPTYQQEIGAA